MREDCTNNICYLFLEEEEEEGSSIANHRRAYGRNFNSQEQRACKSSSLMFDIRL